MTRIAGIRFNRIHRVFLPEFEPPRPRARAGLEGDNPDSTQLVSLNPQAEPSVNSASKDDALATAAEQTDQVSDTEADLDPLKALLEAQGIESALAEMIAVQMLTENNPDDPAFFGDGRESLRPPVVSASRAVIRPTNRQVFRPVESQTDREILPETNRRAEIINLDKRLEPRIGEGQTRTPARHLDAEREPNLSQVPERNASDSMIQLFRSAATPEARLQLIREEINDPQALGQMLRGLRPEEIQALLADAATDPVLLMTLQNAEAEARRTPERVVTVSREPRAQIIDEERADQRRTARLLRRTQGREGDRHLSPPDRERPDNDARG